MEPFDCVDAIVGRRQNRKRTSIRVIIWERWGRYRRTAENDVVGRRFRMNWVGAADRPRHESTPA